MIPVDNQKRFLFTENLKRNWGLYLIPYVALVLLHVILTLTMQYPSIWDEFGYLGRARYLSGTSHIPHDIGPYHFGYSLFLLPSFWLFSDPYSVYKAVLITNSLLLSTMYFPIYYILHTLLNNKRKLSAYISVVCCLYPAFVLQSNLAWSESAFIPIYAFFIASFGAFLKYKSNITVLLFSFLAGFLYTIHPRALPIIAVAICHMFVLTGLKQTRKSHMFLCVLMLTCICFLTISINNHFLTMDSGETTNEIITSKLLLLFSPANLAPLFLEAVGQLLYLLLSTYGLFLVGLMYACIVIVNKWRQHRLGAFSDIDLNIFCLLVLSSLGVFIASILQMQSPSRADHFFYGRYNEGFIALYLMLGLLTVYYAKDCSWKSRIINPWLSSALILILMIIVYAAHGYKTMSEMGIITNVNVINILGIYPLIGILRRLNIMVISLIYIPLIFLLMYAFRFRFKAGLGLLLLYFFIVSLSGYTIFYVRASYIKEITKLASHISSMEDIKVISYDKRFQNADTWLAYQYLLPNVLFRTFNSGKGELPASKVVISGGKWKDRQKLRAKLIARENKSATVPFIIKQLIGIFFKGPLSPKHRIDQSLWLLPEKVEHPIRPVSP
ncbi:MAG: hypothetical protein ACLFUL_00230 [Desulfobacteraceae bacterium]